MSKYGNRKVVVNGIEFDSAIEGSRYRDLSLMEKAGEISGLTIQPHFTFEMNGLLFSTYTADFEYFENNTRIVEDVKGFKQPDYSLRARMFIAFNPDCRFAEYTKAKGRVFKKVQSGKLLSC